MKTLVFYKATSVYLFNWPIWGATKCPSLLNLSIIDNNYPAQFQWENLGLMIAFVLLKESLQKWPKRFRGVSARSWQPTPNKSFPFITLKRIVYSLFSLLHLPKACLWKTLRTGSLPLMQNTFSVLQIIHLRHKLHILHRAYLPAK